MQLLVLLKYLCTVVLTNEAGNIWLYVLPESLMDAAYQVGVYIAGLLA